MSTTAVVLIVLSARLLQDHDEHFAMRRHEVVGCIFGWAGIGLLFADFLVFLWRAMP